MTARQPHGVPTWENYFRGEPQQPNDAREGVVMDWQCGRLTPKLMTPALIDLLSEFGSHGLPPTRTETRRQIPNWPPNCSEMFRFETEKSVVRSMVGAPGLEPGTR
jgi:hypothetical protein